MIDDGNILIPYHIQAKRQKEALQKTERGFTERSPSPPIHTPAK